MVYFRVRNHLGTFFAIIGNCPKKHPDGFGPQNRPQNRYLPVRKTEGVVLKQIGNVKILVKRWVLHFDQHFIFSICLKITPEGFGSVDHDFEVYFGVRSRLVAFSRNFRKLTEKYPGGIGPQNRPRNRNLLIRKSPRGDFETNLKCKNFGQKGASTLAKIFIFPICLKIIYSRGFGPVDHGFEVYVEA